MRKIEETPNPRYRGIGVRRSCNNSTLDVYYPLIWKVREDSLLEDLLKEFFSDEEPTNQVNSLSSEVLLKVLMVMEDHTELLEEEHLLVIKELITIVQEQSNPTSLNEYHKIDLISVKLFDLDVEPHGIEDIYFRLHLISSRRELPHSINLNGVFGILPNLVWTTRGPIFPNDFSRLCLQSLWGNSDTWIVTHVDKFPYMLNYVVPKGVRVADACRVRLGAYLGEGTTVMPVGYVNFNAGTRGTAMVEGRISAGVLVGEDSDVGGGASIMGTLSGGNKHIIEIGPKCLIGANAGTGISLGFGCTIAAGTYVTAASKVYLYDKDRKPVNLQGEPVVQGGNVCKAAELSGRDHLLFYQDTSDGKLVCRPNEKTISLNTELHTNSKNP